MVRFGPNRAVGAGQRLGLCPRHRPRRDRVKVERPSVVREPHCPVEPLFYQDVGGPDGVANLIELPFMHNREVLPHAPGDFETQTPLQLSNRGRRSMQIGGLRRGHGKAPVVDRQIVLQETVRVFQGRDPGQAQLETSETAAPLGPWPACQGSSKCPQFGSSKIPHPS
jgi:hypothetical protein